jgi:hypothetical protein
MAYLDPGQPPCRSRLAGQGDVPCIGFDQDGADIIAAGMLRQDPDDVVTLPGTQADHIDQARRGPVNRIGQVRSDASQPRAQ